MQKIVDIAGLRLLSLEDSAFKVGSRLLTLSLTDRGVSLCLDSLYIQCDLCLTSAGSLEFF